MSPARDLLSLTRNVTAQLEPHPMPNEVKIVNRRSIDLSPFARAKRELATDRKVWIETNDLIAELVWNSREPIPDVVLIHLLDRLDGNAKKRQGRGRRTSGRKLTNLLIAASFERRESWLTARQSNGGLKGWPPIQSADWWQGPPSERAARMVKQRLGLSLGWERVRNIAYEARKASRNV